MLCNRSGTLPGFSTKPAGWKFQTAVFLARKSSRYFYASAEPRRLLSRFGILQGDEGYEPIRSLFMENLPHNADLFNEYHALIVEECKKFCLKAKPLCPQCPLLPLCPFGENQSLSGSESRQTKSKAAKSKSR